MYNQNIIFMDGEFNGLKANGTEFLSLGLIQKLTNGPVLE